MTGSIVGTPHYMSPEQVQGQPVDGRSDQFSLAVIGYEMLTGEKPYTGEHLTTVVYKIVAEEPVPPRRLNPSLSTGIENVLRKALAKKPDARYRNCQDFVESLEKACGASKGWKPMPRGGLLNAPTMADVKAPPVAAPAPAALPPPRRKGRPEPTATATAEVKRKSGFPVFLLAVLVAAGLLALIGWQAAPWLMPGRQPSDSGEHRAAAPKEESPVPATPPVTAPLVVPGVAPGDAKPSPVGPAARNQVGPSASACQPRARGSQARACRSVNRGAQNRASPADAGAAGRPAGGERHEQSGGRHRDTRRQSVPGMFHAVLAAARHRAGTRWRLPCPAIKSSGASSR